MKNRLLKLLNDNRAVRGPRRFEVVSAKAAQEATIYLYDVIVSSNLEAEFFGGVSAERFNKELAAIDAPVINIRINSPGGDVFAARAMETAIQNKKASGTKVVGYVDGYAASAATFVAMAASEVEISDGGFMMIHQAWTLAYGNADDLVATAALLEQIDNTIVATYAKRTGVAEDKLRAMIKSETWLNAQDAVDLGFADRVAEAKVENRIEWKVGAYEAAPASHEGQDPAIPTAPVPEEAPASKREVEEGVACVMSYDDAARRLRHLETIAA
jgi:ATP-dependent Clp protease protease subunit